MTGIEIGAIVVGAMALYQLGSRYMSVPDPKDGCAWCVHCPQSWQRYEGRHPDRPIHRARCRKEDLPLVSLIPSCGHVRCGATVVDEPTWIDEHRLERGYPDIAAAYNTFEMNEWRHCWSYKRGNAPVHVHMSDR